MQTKVNVKGFGAGVLEAAQPHVGIPVKLVTGRVVSVPSDMVSLDADVGDYVRCTDVEGEVVKRMALQESGVWLALDNGYEINAEDVEIDGERYVHRYCANDLVVLGDEYKRATGFDTVSGLVEVEGVGKMKIWSSDFAVAGLPWHHDQLTVNYNPSIRNLVRITNERTVKVVDVHAPMSGNIQELCWQVYNRYSVFEEIVERGLTLLTNSQDIESVFDYMPGNFQARELYTATSMYAIEVAVGDGYYLAVWAAKSLCDFRSNKFDLVYLEGDELLPDQRTHPLSEEHIVDIYPFDGKLYELAEEKEVLKRFQQHNGEVLKLQEFQNLLYGYRDDEIDGEDFFEVDGIIVSVTEELGSKRQFLTFGELALDWNQFLRMNF
jgi:hypothetical protein